MQGCLLCAFPKLTKLSFAYHFFFHLIHSPGFHWSVLDEILTTTCSFEANIKMVIDFDVSIV